jgi:hypothetical protein
MPSVYSGDICPIDKISKSPLIGLTITLSKKTFIKESVNIYYIWGSNLSTLLMANPNISN